MLHHSQLCEVGHGILAALKAQVLTRLADSALFKHSIIHRSRTCPKLHMQFCVLSRLGQTDGQHA